MKKLFFGGSLLIVLSVVTLMGKRYHERNIYATTPTFTPTTFAKLGDTLFGKNALEEACKFYHLGLKYFPENSLLWRKVAFTEQLCNHPEEVLNALKMVCQLQPQDDRAHAQLSTLYYQKGAFREAFQEIKTAIDLVPDHKEYLFRFTQVANLLGEYSQSLQAYEKLNELDPQNRLLAKGAKYVAEFAQAHTKEQNNLLLKQAESDPKVLEEYLLLFGEDTPYLETIQRHHYQEIVKKEPKNTEAWYQLALHHYDKETLETAEKCISKALVFQGKNIDYLKLAARIAGERGNHEKEIVHYRKILTIQPKERVALHALHVLMPGSYEISPVDVLTPPLSVKAQTFVDLAESAQRTHEFAEALKIYQIGVKFFPQEYLLWKGIAEVQKSRKEGRNALQAYRTAIKCAPQEDSLYVDLASLLVELYQYKEALEQIEKAVELKNKNLTYLCKQAQLANLNEDYPLSIYTYNQILKLHPGDKMAQFALPKVRAWAKENCGQGRENALVDQISVALEKKEFFKAQQLLTHYEMLYGKTGDFLQQNAELVFLEGVKKKSSAQF